MLILNWIYHYFMFASPRSPSLHARHNFATGARVGHWCPALLAAGSALGISLALPHPTNAEVLADNLSGGTKGELRVGDGTSVEFWQAMKFQTTTASIIRSVTTRLRQSIGVTAGTATFDIYSDSPGAPGSAIATALTKNISELTGGFVDYSATGLSISLEQNSSYWLVGKASGSSRFVWEDTDSTSGFGAINPPVRDRSNNAGTSWESGAPFTTFATLRIEADPVPGVPGPLPVLGASAAFGWSRRIRRRIKSAASQPCRGQSSS